jgi:Kef-type K+ transport system membrane component KefB
MLATGLAPSGFELGALPTRDQALAILRDASIVGLAGALSAPTLVRAGEGRAAQLSRAIGVLDDVFGVIALACLAAWLRPATEGWSLPGVGWVFVTFGMSMTLGLVVYALLKSTDSAAERTSLLLGSVCFTAGMAGAFELPPLVVCFLAGVLLRNLPGEEKDDLLVVFDRLERPIYLVFLLIVGALWRIDDWRGWALLPVFVLARVGGRWLGARTARRLPEEARPPELETTSARELVTPPMGQLAIAFVVTAQALYESPAIRAIVTAVIGGSIVSEVLVQVGARRDRAASSPVAVEVEAADAPEEAGE